MKLQLIIRPICNNKVKYGKRNHKIRPVLRIKPVDGVLREELPDPLSKISKLIDPIRAEMPSLGGRILEQQDLCLGYVLNMNGTKPVILLGIA